MRNDEIFGDIIIVDGRYNYITIVDGGGYVLYII